MSRLNARTGEHRDAAALVGDRYEIIREIGRGGMGTVYLARDRVRDLPVALKTVARADAGRVAHLKREFRAVSGLRHPNLVELHELTAEPTGCFFTMELIEGVDPRRWVRGDDSEFLGADHHTAQVIYEATLSQAAEETVASAPPTPTPTVSGTVRVGRPPPGPVRIDAARLRSVIAQLAEGLAFLHGRGVVHRDVKVSNALVRRDGRVKLLDFGLAFDWRAASPAEGTGVSSGPLVGTVAYMAPEYLHGHRVSPAMDLYALGVLIFELVTGAPPFGGSFYEIVAAHVEQRAPRAIAFNPDVPEDIDELIAMLLVKDPAVRPTAEEVADAARSERSAERRWARPRPRFVGRTQELAALQAVVREASAGAPRLLVVSGPSGAGKTALCDELLERMALGEAGVWRGRCDERERVAYRAFDEIVDRLAAELEQASATVADLEHAGALSRVFPMLTAAVAPSIRELAAPADLRVERERAFGALAALLGRRLGARTGVIVIDDLQWADDGSLELIEVLVRVGSRLAIVATCTTDDDGRTAADIAALVERLGARADIIAIGPLEDARVAELVRSVAPSSPAEVVADAVRAAAGNPYLAELVASELAAGDGASDDVAGAEARRLGRLGVAELAVAQAASAAGGTVSFAQLRHVTELAGPSLQSALRALELERVLRTAAGGAADSGDVVYDFYHHRLCRAAYQLVDEPPRRQLHRRFADWYEGRSRPEREALAHHWSEAGEPARAAPWALAAADIAIEQLAFDHAARWYQRAIELGLPARQAGHARERAAEALLWSGAFAAAAQRCRELAEARAGAERDRWLLRAAEAEIKLGELAPGLALIDRILPDHPWTERRVRGAARTVRAAARLLLPRRRAADERDRVRAEAYRVIASFLSTPRPVEAFEYVLRSIELAQRRGDIAGEGTALAVVAGYVAAGTLGRFGDAILGRSTALTEASGDPYARMVSAAAAVILAAVRGHWARMRAASDRGERICRELGLERSWEASFLRSYRVLGELYAGEVERALELAGSLYERAPDLFTRAMIGSFRGRALAAAGRTDDAAQSLDALRRDPAAAQGLPRMYRFVLEGELALATGRWRDAVAVAGEMAAAARSEWLSLFPAVGVMHDVIAATGELGAGAPARARALARRIGRKGRSSFYAPTALRLEAQAERALGDEARARALLGRAAALAVQRGGLVERAAIAALQGTPPPPELAPVVAWVTASRG